MKEFLTRISPRYKSPEHLNPAIELLEAAYKSPQRIVFSAPPRHGKSETLFHWIAQYLVKFPHHTIGYCTYSSDLAHSKSRIIREYAIAAGVKLRSDSKAAHEWRTIQGGGVLAVGVAGPLTGHGLNLLVVDDPHRSRAEAESSVIRKNTHDWVTSTALSRLEPGGSAIITQTRWHQDDLAGFVLSDPDTHWQEINLPAINDVGEALWPERWPVDELQRRRQEVGEFEWASLYMGNPRPRGGALFKDARFYDKLPDNLTRDGIGLDLAYTAKSYSDYSVCIAGSVDEDKNIYLRTIRRDQCEATKFASQIKSVRQLYQRAKVRWFIGSIEKGIVDFLHKQGIPVDGVVARNDKFVRAQEVAAAWNAGKIFLPREPWVDAFVSEVLSFTGISDAHDDQVDALAALHSVLVGKKHSVGMVQKRVSPF